jgi:hypothetical protein
MSISSSAVLVELNISVWTANKLDKGATDSVLASNSASKDSAQVRKNLMAGTDKRKKISDYAAKARLYHNQTTLSWSDKGARLLPTSLFMDYKSNMNVYQQNMNTMIEDFYANYGDLIELSKHHMGDLFNPYDYPSIEELRSKFGFRLVFSPLPEGGDFRLDIPKADMDELGQQYESAFNDRLKDAMREPWEKLHKTLIHISEKLTDIDGDDETKKRYHDTLITNAQELCGLLTHLNVTKDPLLENARRSLELTMLGVDIEAIKESPDVRSSVKAKVDDILKKFDW